MNKSTKLTNPKDKASIDKLDLTLFPQTAIVYGALQMQEGDLKYGGYNYREAGVNASVYVNAALGHLISWYNGEERTPEGGYHLGGALASIAILIDAIECNNLNDDRPPVVPVAQLLRRMREKVRDLQQSFPNGPERFTELGRGKKRR